MTAAKANMPRSDSSVRSTPRKRSDSSSTSVSERVENGCKPVQCVGRKTPVHGSGLKAGQMFAPLGFRRIGNVSQG